MIVGRDFTYRVKDEILKLNDIERRLTLCCKRITDLKSSYDTVQDESVRKELISEIWEYHTIYLEFKNSYRLVNMDDICKLCFDIKADKLIDLIFSDEVKNLFSQHIEGRAKILSIGVCEVPQHD